MWIEIRRFESLGCWEIQFGENHAGIAHSMFLNENDIKYLMKLLKKEGF